MARLKFPYPEDREVINHFLDGKKSSHQDLDQLMHIDKGVLHLGYTPMCYYMPDGTLQFITPHVGYNAHAAANVVNYLLEALGSDDRVVIEQRGDDQAWFIGGNELTPGVPTVVAGPMTIMAWRAERGVKLKGLPT